MEYEPIRSCQCKALFEEMFMNVEYMFVMNIFVQKSCLFVGEGNAKYCPKLFASSNILVLEDTLGYFANDSGARQHYFLRGQGGAGQC